MNGYLEQVKRVIQATAFHSPTSYSWFGKQSPRLPPKTKRALTPKTARKYLLFHLQFQLYNDFYCQGHAVPTDRVTPSPPVEAGAKPFVEALSEANSGRGYWEGGWEVRSIDDGKVAVRKERAGPNLWVRPEECLVPEGEVIAPGTRLSLRFPQRISRHLARVLRGDE